MQGMDTVESKIKDGVIKTQPSYTDTLIAIPVGQSRRFKAYCRLVNGIRNAAWRLNKAGAGKWDIEMVDPNNVLVTRKA